MFSGGRELQFQFVSIHLHSVPINLDAWFVYTQEFLGLDKKRYERSMKVKLLSPFKEIMPTDRPTDEQTN